MKSILVIALLFALAGCGKDDDVQTITKDMKVCRDGGGKPALSAGMVTGLHIICWPKDQ